MTITDDLPRPGDPKYRTIAQLKRKCAKCGKEKMQGFFTRDASRVKRGCHPYCRACRAATARESRLNAKLLAQALAQGDFAA